MTAPLPTLRKQARKHAAKIRWHRQALEKVQSVIRWKLKPKPISRKGVAFISQWEGFSPVPTDALDGHATVGRGFVIHRGPVTPEDLRGIWVEGQARPGRLTEAEADRLLARELKRLYVPVVLKLFTDGPLKGKFRQNRLDALVSFVYNLGPASVTGIPGFETIGRAIKAGNIVAIAQAIKLYDYSGGVRMEGLSNRRKAESELFLTGKYE